MLDAATNVYRPNNRSADNTLLASDHVSYNDLIELNALMQDQGGTPMDNGDYVIVMSPQVHAAMLKDPDFKEAAKYAAPEKIWKGQVGRLGGFNLIVSNSQAFTTPTTQAVAGKADKVYSSFAIAMFAYQITDLQGMQMYSVAPGGHTDPLQQSRKLGWKFAFKSLITNQSWIRRVRSAGLNSLTV